MKVSKLFRGWAGLILAAAVALSTLSAAAVVADEYRWWVWRGEFIEVAGDTYSAAISTARDRQLSVQIHIMECEKSPSCREKLLLEFMKNFEDLKDKIKSLEEKKSRHGKKD